MVSKYSVFMTWMSFVALIPCLQSATAEETGIKHQIDLSYVTPDTVAAIVVHPRLVLTGPKMAAFPIDLVTAPGKEHLGVDPKDIEQAVGIVEFIEGEPRCGLILHLVKAIDQQKLVPEIMMKLPDGIGIFTSDDKTLIFAHEALLQKISQNHVSPKEGKMARVLQSISPLPDALAVVNMTAIRSMLDKQLQMAPIPPELAEVKRLPGLLTSIGIKANVSGEASLLISMKANNESDAEQVERIVSRLLEEATKQAKAKIGTREASGEPKENPMLQAQGKAAEKLLGSLRPSRDGRIVTIRAGLTTTPGQ